MEEEIRQLWTELGMAKAAAEPVVCQDTQLVDTVIIVEDEDNKKRCRGNEESSVSVFSGSSRNTYPSAFTKKPKTNTNPSVTSRVVPGMLSNSCDVSVSSAVSGRGMNFSYRPAVNTSVVSGSFSRINNRPGFYGSDAYHEKPVYIDLNKEEAVSIINGGISTAGSALN